MGDSDGVGKARAKIVSILAGMLALPPEAIKPEARYADLLQADPGAIRDFTLKVEQALGVMLSDFILDAYPRVGELVDYCAAHRSVPRGERLYVVVCKMPDGSTRERIYAARGHEKAAQMAMDDGAAAVVSVEREDAEDGSPSGPGTLTKVLFPLLVGLLPAVAIFVYFWWKRGFARFW